MGVKSEEFKLHFIAKKRLTPLNHNTNLNSSLLTLNSSLFLRDYRVTKGHVTT